MVSAPSPLVPTTWSTTSAAPTCPHTVANPKMSTPCTRTSTAAALMKTTPIGPPM